MEDVREVGKRREINRRRGEESKYSMVSTNLFSLFTYRNINFTDDTYSTQVKQNHKHRGSRLPGPRGSCMGQLVERKCPSLFIAGNTDRTGQGKESSRNP